MLRFRANWLCAAGGSPVRRSWLSTLASLGCPRLPRCHGVSCEAIRMAGWPRREQKRDYVAVTPSKPGCTRLPYGIVCGPRSGLALLFRLCISASLLSSDHGE
jgi:hypothetical protein